MYAQRQALKQISTNFLVLKLSIDTAFTPNKIGLSSDKAY